MAVIAVRRRLFGPNAERYIGIGQKLLDMLDQSMQFNELKVDVLRREIAGVKYEVSNYHGMGEIIITAPAIPEEQEDRSLFIERFKRETTYLFTPHILLQISRLQTSDNQRTLPWVRAMMQDKFAAVPALSLDNGTVVMVPTFGIVSSSSPSLGVVGVFEEYERRPLNYLITADRTELGMPNDLGSPEFRQIDLEYWYQFSKVGSVFGFFQGDKYYETILSDYFWQNGRPRNLLDTEIEAINLSPRVLISDVQTGLEIENREQSFNARFGSNFYELANANLDASFWYRSTSSSAQLPANGGTVITSSAPIEFEENIKNAKVYDVATKTENSTEVVFRSDLEDTINRVLDDVVEYSLQTMYSLNLEDGVASVGKFESDGFDEIPL